MIMPRQCILRTDRLVTETWLPSDVDDLLAVHSDVETMRFVRNGRPESRSETTVLIDEYIAEQAETGFTKWRVADHTGRLVGRAGFGAIDGGRELGYTIRRELWGHGFATEIAAGLVKWHLANAPDVRLYAYVAAENPASRAVLQKTGFDLIGREVQAQTLCDLFTLNAGGHRCTDE
ncbi:GNAT family N-acetyltransferase [Rudaeicoccus suwonensis]|uniref:RimJ/RimL family protein N-acetyltransferase n=1 Tax=Rudaeicoccus suwonensis TaxID=657409 RepID=A0A561E6Q2_9MICO|nr:RimJ/RimL family protein N-acetyltransferase [Rudaeicoccus suwonensis]